MPEAKQPEAPRKEPSLTGFYIVTAIVAALVGLGVWLWTPLKIAYWERQAREYRGELVRVGGPGTSLYAYKAPSDLKAIDAFDKLARVGPRAAPAFRRLLRHPVSQVRGFALVALISPKASWALPLIVEASADQDPEVAGFAVFVAEQIAGQTFSKRDRYQPVFPMDVSEGRKNLLDWWEREGRAKYEATGTRP